MSNLESSQAEIPVHDLRTFWGILGTIEDQGITLPEGQTQTTLRGLSNDDFRAYIMRVDKNTDFWTQANARQNKQNVYGQDYAEWNKMLQEAGMK